MQNQVALLDIQIVGLFYIQHFKELKIYRQTIYILVVVIYI